MSSFLLGYYRARAQSLEESVDRWSDHCDGLKRTIGQLEAQNQSLRANLSKLQGAHKSLHATATALQKDRDAYQDSDTTRGELISVLTACSRAQKEYLLDLLDEAHGGAENNPARHSDETGLEVLFGEDQGKKLSRLETATIRAMRKALAENPDAAAIPNVRKLGYYEMYGEPRADALEPGASATSSEDDNEA